MSSREASTRPGFVESGAQQGIAVLEERRPHASGDAVQGPGLRARRLEPDPRRRDLRCQPQRVRERLLAEPVEIDRAPVAQLKRERGSATQVEPVIAREGREGLQHGSLCPAQRVGAQSQGRRRRAHVPARAERTQALATRAGTSSSSCQKRIR